MQPPTADRERLVIIPAYNSGHLLVQTVASARQYWNPVWVALDGTTDDSTREIAEHAKTDPGVRVLRLEVNEGKGGALLHAMREAGREGFRFALAMDADGQHPADRIPEFMALSSENPNAMILGEPIFGSDAPPERVKGRRVGNWFASLETLWGGINDSLFGFRLYPIAETVRILESISTARRFDFDTEIAVRLFWSGIRPINRPVPVTYPPREKGGVTHFRYVRDNLLLTGTHTRLCLLMLPRLLKIWSLQRKWKSLLER